MRGSICMVAELFRQPGRNMSKSNDFHGAVPVWDGKASTIETWRERVDLYVLSTRKDDRYLCGARVLGTLNPSSNEYKIVRKLIPP